MSFNDYVKFVTQQVVIKMDQPKAEKPKKADHNEERLSFMYNAFGLLPLGLSFFFKKRAAKKQP